MPRQTNRARYTVDYYRRMHWTTLEPTDVLTAAQDEIIANGFTLTDTLDHPGYRILDRAIEYLYRQTLNQTNRKDN